MSETATAAARSLPSHADGRTLSVRALGKSYGTGAQENWIIRNLDLEVPPGEFVAIVGPSGVGKTTLLRSLSGLVPPTEGGVFIDGSPLAEPHPEVGVVFQDYSRSLLPWMTTLDNVAFPLQGKGMKKGERLAIAEKNLAAVGLAGKGHLYAWEMSGGMQQRVAIARALAYDSKILLMDEPFASVDAQTRLDLEDLVVDLHVNLGVTIILVTHDIDEALYLADRVVVIADKPAHVVDQIETGFGSHRDQVETRADPRFAEARGRILTRLRA
ncbi:ABC transporter ATP-binding protein [Salinibacterium sp. dk2585]|uniref:ABC transporter ATP-binding protein n=1 Tax=unclassified Salinibacterium TaxID=2632331 RepID=UPI0011C2514A|nr:MULTISPECIES: ABC transporter ATP-binding protein [unclassified Salinibacterium]QEE60370.1 ABC transporter ATP-binding protein [Salinibacterium sp. dk2585]TXK55443.1 ABC transporter ATP-binding protein [Salinibacterium sp. dk5596]